MTPEQQRIAIAEACGWKQPDGDEAQDGFRDDDGVWHNVPPDFLSDLNAMHEADKARPIDSQILWNVVNSGKVEREKNLHDVINATAAQRAEAFIRTIGKWKE